MNPVVIQFSSVPFKSKYIGGGSLINLVSEYEVTIKAGPTLR